MSDDRATEDPLDTKTVRDGFMRLVHEWDAQAISTLLTRYLAQPLSDSETPWAYLHLANALACSGSTSSSPGAVTARR